MELDFDQFLAGPAILPCNFDKSPFFDKDHGHVPTGNLRIFKNSTLRKIICKGLYRQASLCLCVYICVCVFMESWDGWLKETLQVCAVCSGDQTSYRFKLLKEDNFLLS